MSVVQPFTRRVRATRPTMSWTSAAVLALAVSVFVLPFRLASAWQGSFASRAALVDVVGSGFVSWWSGGTGAVGPDLQRAVDFWALFHVLKAVLAALLLATVARLVLQTTRAGLQARRRPHRLALAAGLLLEAAVAAIALVMVVANVQGAVAPMSSVLGFLPRGAPDPSLAAALREARQALTSGDRSPTTELMVHDFVAYHAAMVGLGGATTLALIALAARMWRRRRDVPHVWAVRVLSGGAVVVLALASFFALVTVANLSTVAHPEPALLDFLRGGG